MPFLPRRASTDLYLQTSGSDEAPKLSLGQTRFESSRRSKVCFLELTRKPSKQSQATWILILRFVIFWRLKPARHPSKFTDRYLGHFMSSAPWCGTKQWRFWWSWRWCLPAVPWFDLKVSSSPFVQLFLEEEGSRFWMIPVPKCVKILDAVCFVYPTWSPKLMAIATSCGHVYHVLLAVPLEFHQGDWTLRSSSFVPCYQESCAYVINLARRPDRLQRLQELLASTNPELLEHLERIDAVDGQNVSLHSVQTRAVVEDSALARAKRAKQMGLYSIVHDAENNLVNFDDHFTEGAVACAMSHHLALTKVAQHPSAKWGLILEDDVSLVVPQVHRELSTILDQLPENWNAASEWFA